MTRQEPKRILLTGASGVLGQALLASQGEREIIALTHSSGLPHQGTPTLRGDITQVQLGLPANQYAELAASVEVVIHAAALTDFGKPYRSILKTNVTGTAHILEFCRHAGADLCYVSTAFVHANNRQTEGRLNAYERSKLEAENRVRQSSVNAAIIRPSLIIGDSSNGAIAEYQGFHMLLSMLLNQQLPILTAGSGDGLVDIVPQDYVAQTIWNIADGNLPLQDYWLTSGTAAPTVRELIEFGTCFARDQLGIELDAPRLVTQDMFERLIKPAFFPALPLHMRKRFNRFAILSKYMSLQKALPSDMDYLCSGSTTLGPWNTKQTIWNNMQYLLQQGHIQTPKAMHNAVGNV